LVSEALQANQGLLAERAVVALERSEALKDTPRQYLNRLSDLLFVLARVVNRMTGGDDVYWTSARLAQQAPGPAGVSDAG